MRKETDLSGVKSVAKALLYMDIDIEAEYFPMLVQHPIYESVFQSIKVDGENKIINIMESKENLYLTNEYFKAQIDECETLMRIYLIIRKSYRLTFIKFTKKYLSMKDFCSLFSDAWVTSENPNGDVNVPISLAVKWFKQADKTLLMDTDEYKVYSELPDVLKVYRGVGVGRNPRGLSWTMNMEKAEWFAHRYDRNDEKGYVQVATIIKSDVLAYFNTRNEEEIVVSVKKDLIGE